MTRVVAGALALAFIGAACDGGLPHDSQSEQYALIGAFEDRLVVILGDAPPSQQFEAILANEALNTPWVKFEFPAATDIAAGVVADLTDPQADAVFAQNYFDNCGGAGAAVRFCFLVERYEFGEDGLAGSVSIARTENDLRISFSLVWEGMTDRFDGPAQWHRHSTECEAAIGNAYVEEVELP